MGGNADGVVIEVGALMELEPLHPDKPKTLIEAIVATRMSNPFQTPFLRTRTKKPNGSRNATKIPWADRPNVGNSSAPVVTVESVSVVDCAVLVPVNERLVGANTQVAAVGSVPQAKVTVPV